MVKKAIDSVQLVTARCQPGRAPAGGPRWVKPTSAEYRRRWFMCGCRENFSRITWSGWSASVKQMHDYVLGTRIVGESETRGKTRLVLIPNFGQLLGKIAFDGTVHAKTRGYNGPVVLHQESDSVFRAAKLIAFDETGLKVAAAVTSAPTRLQINCIATSLPRLRGRIATRIAWRRVSSSHDRAESITADHTAANVGRDFDKRIDQSLAKLRQVFKSKVPELAPDRQRRPRCDSDRIPRAWKWQWFARKRMQRSGSFGRRSWKAIRTLRCGCIEPC